MNTEILSRIPLIGNMPIAQQVANILNRLIIDGTLEIGEYLPPEDELCQAFSVGRSSVREAIKILETRGMIQKQHGKGVIVVDESVKATSEMLSLMLDQKKSTLEELIEFRVSMEVKMAELAALRATVADLNEIKFYLEMMQNGNLSKEEFAAADFNFHKSIAKASKNHIFELMIETLRPKLFDQIVYTLRANSNPEVSHKYHQKIFDAIKNRDADKAANAMNEHLIGTKDRI